MKKIFFSFLVIFLLAGCVPVATVSPPPSPTVANPPTASPAPTSFPSPRPTETAPVPPAAPAIPITADNIPRLKDVGAFSIANPYRLYFSPDSRHAVAAAQDQVVRFSIPDLREENRLSLAESDALLDVSPLKELAAVTRDHVAINLVSLLTGQTVQSFQPQGQFSAAFFTPDGASLGVVSIDAIRVDLYDLASGSLTGQFSGFQTAAPVYNTFISRDGRSLIWISRARLQLMDLASGQLGSEFAHEDFIAGWDLSPDGALLATSAGGQVDGEFFPLVFLWDARTGGQLQVFTLPQTPAAGLAFSPDGQFLAAATGKTIQFWRVADHAPLIALPGPSENISYLAFSPDGRSLLASAQDGAVHLWQVVP